MRVRKPYIFISHSSQDKEITAFLAKRLRKAGYNVWVDVDSIPDGSTWPREIEKGVRGCGAMVVIMTKRARDSEWVERETLLAMDLRKPLFIALVEDLPLPLHLLNRQYTDFRQDCEAAADKLIAALHAVSLTAPLEEQPPVLSPQPDEENFFRFLQQLPKGEQNALIARELYQWTRKTADAVPFGGKYTPGFHARVLRDATETTVFSLWAYKRQPAVQVQFQYLSSLPPYDDRRLRLSTLESLNALLPEGERLRKEQADRRPTLPLIPALNSAENLEGFQRIIAEIFDNLRSLE